MWLPVAVWLWFAGHRVAPIVVVLLVLLELRPWYGNRLRVLLAPLAIYAALPLLMHGLISALANRHIEWKGRTVRATMTRDLSMMALVETTAQTLADIAVLDDDLDFRTYLEDFLKDERAYTVRTFGNAAEFFAGCEERLPDIVLLDMKMGDVTGDKVLEQLLARWPGLCVIVITGYPSLEDMRATFKLKVFDYLSKPFSLAQLRQVLKNAVEAFGLGQTAQDRLRERLGHAIKLMRVARDWSLKELAAETKLSVSQISAIERGTNLPSIESFLAICGAFEKKPSEVLGSIDF